MTTTRRLLVLLTLTVAAVLGAGSTAANATFADTVALPSTTIGTGTVAPATNVRVDTACTTTTTVVKRTYRVSALGTTQTSYSLTSSTVASTSNVEGDETTTTWTSPTEYTTTQTIKDTELYATLRWKLSPSTRVTGYRMTAHTRYGPFAMGQTGPTATQMTGQYDASVVDYGARLSIDTLTDYGWTATSALSNVVTC